jgi:hypothetical protein
LVQRRLACQGVAGNSSGHPGLLPCHANVTLRKLCRLPSGLIRAGCSYSCSRRFCSDGTRQCTDGVRTGSKQVRLSIPDSKPSMVRMQPATERPKSALRYTEQAGLAFCPGYHLDPDAPVELRWQVSSIPANGTRGAVGRKRLCRPSSGKSPERLMKQEVDRGQPASGIKKPVPVDRGRRSRAHWRRAVSGGLVLRMGEFTWARA